MTEAFIDLYYEPRMFIMDWIFFGSLIVFSIFFWIAWDIYNNIKTEEE